MAHSVLRSIDPRNNSCFGAYLNENRVSLTKTCDNTRVWCGGRKETYQWYFFVDAFDFETGVKIVETFVRLF